MATKTLNFINDEMSLSQQCIILKDEYIKLLNKSEIEKNEWEKREEKGLKLIKQYQIENDKMEKTNKLGIKLIENLRKQIEKYQNEDIKMIINNNNNNGYNNNNDQNEEIEDWKSRYLTEKRTSEYLRAECEDLQHEVEELKKHNESSDYDDNNNDNDKNNNDENNNDKLEKMLAIINEAWEEEVTALIEQYKNDDINNLKMEMKNKFNNINNNNNNTNNYKSLYEEAIASKLKLVQETSQEIENLRQIIYEQNTTVYRSLFDRIVRYHNLDGAEDTLFQLMVDAELKK